MLEKRSPGCETLLSIVIIFLSFIGVFSFFFWHSQFSVTAVLSLIFSNLFPEPYETGFYGKELYIYEMIYIVILLSIALSIIIARVFETLSKWGASKRKICYTHNPFCLLIIVFIGVTLIQVTQHYIYFVFQYHRYYGKTLAQKEALLFGDPYTFAMNCKKYLRGYHAATLITDMDIKRPREMTIHRRLAYFLWPINIREHRKGERVDCLVVFSKKDAMNSIPEDYVVQYKFDENNILAVKRGAIQ